MEFPIFKTKIDGQDQKFDLNNPEERRKYFELKAGPEIRKIKEYFEKGNTFIAYLLGKKNSGKGTYAKLFMEILGDEYVTHISIGDVVREAHQDMLDSEKKQEITDFLKTHYRGYISIEEAIDNLLSRNTQTLLPTEFILTLVKREIDQLPKKAIFIDGFPRSLDQISYSLFFRDLINYRKDLDLFILIDVPESVIDERIKYRRVCPKCQTPRNLKLLPTNEARHDKENDQFYLMCDNPKCDDIRMIQKEGDDLGIEPIRDRLRLDDELINKAFSLHGIPKILLRNSVPVNKANEFVDDYEITPEYNYELNTSKAKVDIIEKPWVTENEKGVLSYSLLPPPVVVSMIKQLAKILSI